MWVNSRVLTEKSDLFEDIQIPNCPSQFKSVAERLMMMATKPGYSVPDYNTVSQLDKVLTLHFWKEYDGFNNNISQTDFEDWFLSSATSSDMISRAIRWLISHNYLLIKPSVQENALRATDNFRRSVSETS